MRSQQREHTARRDKQVLYRTKEKWSSRLAPTLFPDCGGFQQAEPLWADGSTRGSVILSAYGEPGGEESVSKGLRDSVYHTIFRSERQIQVIGGPTLRGQLCGATRWAGRRRTAREHWHERRPPHSAKVGLWDDFDHFDDGRGSTWADRRPPSGAVIGSAATRVVNQNTAVKAKPGDQSECQSPDLPCFSRSAPRRRGRLLCTAMHIQPFPSATCDSSHAIRRSRPGLLSHCQGHRFALTPDRTRPRTQPESTIRSS